MEEEEQPVLWQSESQHESIVSVTLARSITTVLDSRAKNLNHAISGFSSHSRNPPSISPHSLHHSLHFIHKYAADAAHHRHRYSLHQLLLPVIHHSLKWKDSRHGGQAMILLSWLFQDELIFEPIAEALAGIVAVKKDDRYLLLGWCVLVRGLIEYENSVHQSMLGGIRGRYGDLVKILSTCLKDLAGIASKGSTLQDGFELPSRLGVSAGDCLLAVSGALTKLAEVQGKKSKLNARGKDWATTSVHSPSVDEVKLDAKSLLMTKTEGEYTLWHHLDVLICLVQKLLAWSKRSRFLHAKGLEQVVKWLKEIKDHYGSFQDEADSDALKTGDLVLSSCWKHYSMLLHLEDHKFSKHYKELLDQYLSGIQYYMDNHADVKDGGLETRKFFLNCLCLLLGRLDSKRFESTVMEFGMNISRILVPQLTCTDEDVIVGVVSIFKAIILNPNHLQEAAESGQANIVMPFLLHLLDERDGTARAVVMLIAEYCSMSKDNKCLTEVLKRLGSGNISQRRNALDVISEVIHISSETQKSFPYLSWQDIAHKLLERLGDAEVFIREQASKLLPVIDPSLYFAALVDLFYSQNENESSAREAIIGVLKHHNRKVEMIFLLLDHLSKVNQTPDHQEYTGDKGSKLDTDRVLKLVPEWSKSVQDWSFLIGPLVGKMFENPSNATIVKLLSYISEDLANVADLVLHHVMLHVRKQKEIDESFLSRWECRTYSNEEFEEMQRSLFEHLCPLLIIKMLPIKTFNDLNSSIMYGQLDHNIKQDSGCMAAEAGYDCVAALLLNRAFGDFEFEDVRKLSAELSGRIHPQVLYPVLCSKLEDAVENKNVTKIKACLFSICTSLVVRGLESLSHPSIVAIRRMVEKVLLWPCLNTDSVSKAQHGCIDCLALMICAEVQAKRSTRDSMPNRIRVGKKGSSVITYVMNQFLDENMEAASTPELGCGNPGFIAPVPLSFRLCMGNVLISACQKISEHCKEYFAAQVLPSVLHSLEFETKSEIRAACIQVLFSSVYHLRSAVLPYASDLLKVSLQSLRRESEKERVAGAKLLASLMASEDLILESISSGLLEARFVLSSISSSDPSPQLQQLCRQLLSFIISP
ncbi:hypothetical protein HN51_039011 [Arachis hypogaea]|uniref:Uncharacterized protein n=2 Tax=Arachis TaxID=3817 RepID=A0A444YHB8_ARAHY|nr:uncharacterized protein LOC107645460 isoform X1 [Arachis ipaensis]XP_025658944.1 uncharacterized protein LOC112755214 isoform X1 [Arachis hypogaea]QHN84464.1 uncharacterized protein DS421_16g528850 [Arachis hypogaea]RYR01353.1 hypothetical protein Ahy_B06g080221 [Arachis hypogaea]